MATVPESSKYVPGGYVAKKTKTKSELEDYIDEMVEYTEKNDNYTRYDAPITITSYEGELIPVPSENKGRYANSDREAEKKSKKSGEDEGDINLFNITASNRTGTLRRGMHIKYIRKNPRNFVKGGFIRHINSTYIAFRYARGSSTIQLPDVECIYVTNKVGKPKKKLPEPVFKVRVRNDKPKIRITIKKKQEGKTKIKPTRITKTIFGGDGSKPMSLDDSQIISEEYIGRMPYLPKNLHKDILGTGTQVPKVLTLDGDSDIIPFKTTKFEDDGTNDISADNLDPLDPINISTAIEKDGEEERDDESMSGGGKGVVIEPMTGREFPSKYHMNRFLKSKKYKKIVEQMKMPFDARVCCPQCKRRFRDSYTLKRHMNSLSYKEGKCV